MKLGASYNLFDTEELLESSILSIKNEVDYINIVYQTISNTGKKCSDSLLDTLQQLVENKLVDEIILYTPNLKIQPHENELIKRNIGLKYAKKKKCSHFFSLDSDEFYKTEEIKKAKELILQHNIDYTAVQLINYFKEPIYQMSYKDKPVYYVSFIFKIKRFNNFKLNIHFPVLVDPTRRVKGNEFHLFEKDVIQMHHMTLVRKNIRSKLENSSSNNIYLNNNIELYIEYFNNWKEGSIAYPPSNYNNIVDIVKVPNYFNI